MIITNFTNKGEFCGLMDHKISESSTDTFLSLLSENKGNLAVWALLPTFLILQDTIQH